MEVLSVAGAVFGIVAIAGGSAAYFRSSKGDAIIAYQSKESELKDQTIARLEKEIVASTEREKAKDETITELKRHNEYLQKLAQGSPQLKKLTEAVSSLTEVVKTKLGKSNE